MKKWDRLLFRGENYAKKKRFEWGINEKKTCRQSYKRI
jgi:hypothetical protein